MISDTRAIETRTPTSFMVRIYRCNCIPYPNAATGEPVHRGWCDLVRPLREGETLASRDGSP